MASTSGKTYLIVGASRGIGLALTKAIAAQSKDTVVATTRDLSAKASADLLELKSSYKNVHVLAAEVTKLDTLKAAAEEVGKLGLTFDTIIVNAGVSTENQSLLEVTRENFLYGIEVNTLGSIFVYQAFHSLLTAEASCKSVFLSISSNAGATATPMPVPNITYTTSKAAVNHVAAQINLNAPSTIAFAVHPGFVVTDMSTAVARDLMQMSLDDVAVAFGVDLLAPAQSATAMLELLDSADVDKYAGTFVNYDGAELPL